MSLTFETHMLGSTSQDKVLRLQDSEIKLLELIRDCIQARVHGDKEYARLLSLSCAKAARHEPLVQTPLHEVRLITRCSVSTCINKRWKCRQVVECHLSNTMLVYETLPMKSLWNSEGRATVLHDLLTKNIGNKILNCECGMSFSYGLHHHWHHCCHISYHKKLLSY